MVTLQIDHDASIAYALGFDRHAFLRHAFLSSVRSSPHATITILRTSDLPRCSRNCGASTQQTRRYAMLGDLASKVPA